MEGLDRLIAANGQSPASITDFVVASHFNSELQTVCDICDEIGAHLDIDVARTLEALTTDLDGYDLQKGLAFYTLASGAFTKVCFSVLAYIVDQFRIQASNLVQKKAGKHQAGVHNRKLSAQGLLGDCEMELALGPRPIKWLA
ncbi:MAG: hypothetical protein WDN46_00120 [Methylocella sp.]